MKEFYIGKYEVTFDEYAAFLLEHPSLKVEHEGQMIVLEVPHDQGWGHGSQPVINVSWVEARAYAGWLAGVTGKPFRLPTEAEWEYAARSGGKLEKYSGGDDVDAVAWYAENSGGRAHPVGKKAANGLGLHDMSGNVWEWVEDDWHDSYALPGRPDKGAAWIDEPSGSYRVIRGGSWFFDARGCRSAYRLSLAPDYRSAGVGFRLSRSVALGP